MTSSVGMRASRYRLLVACALLLLSGCVGFIPGYGNVDCGEASYDNISSVIQRAENLDADSGGENEIQLVSQPPTVHAIIKGKVVTEPEYKRIDNHRGGTIEKVSFVLRDGTGKIRVKLTNPPEGLNLDKGQCVVVEGETRDSTMFRADEVVRSGVVD